MRWRWDGDRWCSEEKDQLGVLGREAERRGLRDWIIGLRCGMVKGRRFWVGVVSS